MLFVTGKRIGEASSGTLGPMPPQAAASDPPISNQLTKFKLNSVVNQASEAELVVLDNSELKEAYGNYKRVFGVFPPPDEELTAEQLTAVKKLLDADLTPFVDFAVWVPHANRMMRKLKLQGSTFGADGTIQPIEVSGPPSFDFWSKSYACLRTALISWRAVELGRLDMYAGMIRRYVSRYGERAWLQIYQADVRCRGEHMERVRRRGDEERSRALAAGQSHPLDPSRPWDWVWGEVLSDSDFWRVELEEPALLILTRGSKTGLASENVAGPQAGKRYAMETHTAAPPPKRAEHRAIPDDMRNADGSFSHNRKGKALCVDFNQGQCSYNASSVICPKNSEQVHQCSKCLSQQHGAHACSGPSDGGGGKGKGKGWGKNKVKGKGKRHHY